MSESTPAIKVSGLKKSYGNQAVIRSLNLSINAGEFFGLIGVNGAGKTTLIKSLLNFCDIDGGSIEIFAVPHTETRSRARIAFLPERFVPPYYLTGRQFLSYMGHLYAATYDEPRVQEICNVLGLDPSALGKPVRQYSKGMAQKLGIAACLLSGQDLFVFDEPMSGLDPRARALLKRQFERLKSEHKTLFFSTHLLADIEALCDRVAVLHEGSLRFIGTPAEMCDAYGATDIEQAYLSCIG